MDILLYPGVDKGPDVSNDLLASRDYLRSLGDATLTELWSTINRDDKLGESNSLNILSGYSLIVK